MSALGQMTDAQLRDSIAALTQHVQRQQTFQQWVPNNAAQSKPKTPATNAAQSQGRPTRQRPTRSSTLAADASSLFPSGAAAAASTPTVEHAQALQPQRQVANLLQPQPQAFLSTYASRMRTGATLLMQPILGTSVALQAHGASSSHANRPSRRATAINYADPGSGDELPDAGELDSGDDSDFQASGGTRTAVRRMGLGPAGRAGMAAGMGVFAAGGAGSAMGTPVRVAPTTPAQAGKGRGNELDQSYLGQVPPQRFINAQPMLATSHEYPPEDAMLKQSLQSTALVPVRVEFETDTHRVRDCFVWNLHETLVTPTKFAEIFCRDLGLPKVWEETVTNQIRAQLEEHEGIASLDLGAQDRYDMEGVETSEPGEIYPECRVLLEIDVQIAQHHLIDLIEWDLLSPLTPETFSRALCSDLGLGGESAPLIAHAIHEELVKHKRDALEWGVLGSSDLFANATRVPDGMMKDKTGLGLSWGRAPKDGRGPRVLKSVWRDWQEAEEFRTRFEVLTAEEVERKEIERERASRRLRRETSKFQSQAGTRRRR